MTITETREEDGRFEAREEDSRSPTDILYVLLRHSLLFRLKVLHKVENLASQI
jgi:hypothetical protein